MSKNFHNIVKSKWQYACIQNSISFALSLLKYFLRSCCLAVAVSKKFISFTTFGYAFSLKIIMNDIKVYKIYMHNTQHILRPYNSF